MSLAFTYSSTCYLRRYANLEEKDIIEDLANYRGNGGIWGKEFIWKSVSTVLPTVWWNGMCSSRPLSYIASDLLSLPASSAVCERVFSTFGNVHTRKRNRLSNATVEKLVFISQNLKFVEEGEDERKLPGPPPGECDESNSGDRDRDTDDDSDDSD